MFVSVVLFRDGFESGNVGPWRQLAERGLSNGIFSESETEGFDKPPLATRRHP